MATGVNSYNQSQVNTNNQSKVNIINYHPVRTVANSPNNMKLRHLRQSGQFTKKFKASKGNCMLMNAAPYISAAHESQKAFHYPNVKTKHLL
jgi:hypothetical protein